MNILGLLIEDLTPFTRIPNHKGLGGGDVPTIRHHEDTAVMEISFQVGSVPDESSALDCYVHGDHLQIDRDGDELARFGLDEHAAALRILQAFFAKYGWRAGR